MTHATPSPHDAPELAVYRLTLGYQGTAYAGWQRQANAVAVQQRVEDALGQHLGRKLAVVGASRTDAGVHARAQEAHVRLATPFPPKAILHATNNLMPPDIRVLAVARMPPRFNARRHARAKIYRYRLIRCLVLHPLEGLFAVRVERDLDLGAMAEATAHLAGRHDFSAFAATGGSHKDPHRTIFMAGWREEGDAIELLIEGDGFLRGMVRTLVGTLLDVGRGRRSVASFADLLAGRPREAAGPTAPAHGLMLERVLYPPRWEAESTTNPHRDERWPVVT